MFQLPLSSSFHFHVLTHIIYNLFLGYILFIYLFICHCSLYMSIFIFFLLSFLLYCGWGGCPAVCCSLNMSISISFCCLLFSLYCGWGGCPAVCCSLNMSIFISFCCCFCSIVVEVAALQSVAPSIWVFLILFIYLFYFLSLQPLPRIHYLSILYPLISVVIGNPLTRRSHNSTPTMPQRLLVNLLFIWGFF